ncbi:hypothetical protein D3C75_732640 [compost metagenome]
MQEGDVLGANTCLDQQGVVQRHDLHQIAARLDDAANGVDQHLLDDATYRRGDQGALDSILQRFTSGLDLAQLGLHLVELGERLAAKACAGFTDFALDFGDGRFGAGDGQRSGFQLAACLDFGTPQAQQLHFGGRAFRHQRLGHADFLAQQGQAVAELALLGGVFAQLLTTLDQLFFEAGHLVV